MIREAVLVLLEAVLGQGVVGRWCQGWAVIGEAKLVLGEAVQGLGRDQGGQACARRGCARERPRLPGAKQASRPRCTKGQGGCNAAGWGLQLSQGGCNAAGWELQQSQGVYNAAGWELQQSQGVYNAAGWGLQQSQGGCNTAG